MCQKTTTDQQITAAPQMKSAEQVIKQSGPGVPENAAAHLIGDIAKAASTGKNVSTVIIPQHLQKTGKAGSETVESVKAETDEDEEIIDAKQQRILINNF